jgi:hypothetical protein
MPAHRFPDEEMACKQLKLPFGQSASKQTTNLKLQDLPLFRVFFVDDEREFTDIYIDCQAISLQIFAFPEKVVFL